MDELDLSQNERFQQYLASQGIQQVTCSRCGLVMQVRLKQGNEEARLLKQSDKPEGWCVDCATTDFLRNQSPLGHIIEARGEEGMQMLRDTRIQEQFAGLMQAGNADASAQEIRWERVIENWNLPFVRSGKKRSKR